MYQFITGDWGHIFAWEKNVRSTRIVLDTSSQLLVAAQVQRSEASDTFSQASREEMKDLQDSLVNANGEIFERPSDYALTVCEELPSWALGEDPTPSTIHQTRHLAGFFYGAESSIHVSVVHP